MNRLTHLIASVLLSYPDGSTMESLPAIRAALGSLPHRFAAPLTPVVEYLAGTDPSTLAQRYVETFDLRRRCCLYLTYYTHGDTRRRGVALLRFRQAYRQAGLDVLDDELPDHLAVLLEFSAAGHERAATELFVAHRPGLELLRHALDGLRSPYAGAVAAVLATLPPPGPADLATAAQLATAGPPTEQVGIAP